VKLPSDLFASGSGSYVLTAAVTRGIGVSNCYLRFDDERGIFSKHLTKIAFLKASVGTDVEFFTTSFTVTV
jgi:hypothetical protein